MKVEEHPHYWIIEEANGRLSQGVCKLCQETRDFENSVAHQVYSSNVILFARPRSEDIDIPTSGGGGQW